MSYMDYAKKLADIEAIVDALIDGDKVHVQVETLIEVASKLEERKAMNQALRGMAREIHT